MDNKKDDTYIIETRQNNINRGRQTWKVCLTFSIRYE